MVTAKTRLAPEERGRIRAAVAAAEQRTSAHFALVIVQACDRYALFPVIWAAVLALFATGAVALLRPALSIGTGFIINAALFVALVFILDWWPLRLRMVPGTIKRHHARQLAHREFAVRIVGNSHHRNGVLFFVSLRERYIEVLADREIHKRVAPETWENLVADFIAAVKANQLAEGFIAAVASCGAALEAHFPNAGQLARDD
jgi:putative membrane protein